jgi:Ca2+/Na+ antiporter
MPSILQLRKFKLYRFLEGFLAISSIGFLLLAVILAWISPTTFSICLIIYSFLWLLKFSLNVFYTIFSFKQNRRWQTFDFQPFFSQNSTLSQNEQKKQALENLSKFSQKFQNQIGWQEKIQQDQQVFQQNVENESKFWPSNVFHLPIFAVYNEPSEVLLRSLRKILENNYDLNKIIVVISQEARVGDEFNAQIRQEISQQNWILAKLAEKIKPEIELEKRKKENENETAEPNLSPENFELKITNLSENLSGQTNLEKNITLGNLAKSDEEISQKEHFLNTENEKNKQNYKFSFVNIQTVWLAKSREKPVTKTGGPELGLKFWKIWRWIKTWFW